MEINIELKSKKIIVFDVETTGLLPKPVKDENGQIVKPPQESFPHILQLSYVIYNLETDQIEKVYNNYINVGENVVISDEITRITGITRDIVFEKGIPIYSALCEFYNDLKKCDTAVAHNIAYDTRVIQQEMYRNRHTLKILKSDYYEMTTIFGKKFCESRNLRLYCTMKYGTNVCNIMVTYPSTSQPADAVTGEPATFTIKKAPKLGELYTHLFHRDLPANMHNSIIDVLVCLQCFLAMNSCGALADEDFDELCKKYT
jgi:DNA polymerase III epsilon subunit-like protein